MAMMNLSQFVTILCLSFSLVITNGQEPVVMEYPKGSKNGRQYQPGAVWHEKFSAKGMFRNFPIIRSPTTAVETEGVKRTSIQTENRDEKTDSDNQRPGEFRSFLSRFPSPKLSANNNGGTSTASQGTTTQVITTTEDLFEAVHPLRRKNHTTKLISPKDGLFEVIFPSPESLADRPTITKFKLIPRVQPESLGIDEETDVKLLSETIGNRIENSTELNRANQLKPETKNPELWAHNQGFWHFTPTNTTEIPISNVTAGSESPASWSSWSQCNNGRRVRNWQCDPAKKHLCNAPKATEEQLCGEPSLELPSPSENTGEPPVLPVKPSEFDDFARKFSIPTEPTTDGIILDFITVSSPLSPQFPLVNDDSQQSQPPSFSPDQSNLAVVDNSQASVINRQPPTPSFISITQPTVIDNDGSFNQNAPPSNLPWEPRPPVLIPPRQWPGHFISESSARQPNFPLPPDGAQQLHPSGSGIFPNNNDEFLLPNGYILSFRKPFRQSETDNSTNPTVDPNIE